MDTCSTGRLRTTEPAAPAAVAVAPQPPGNPRLPLKYVVGDYIFTILQQTKWVITGPRGAAKILGLHPGTPRNRITKLGLSRPTD